MAGPPPVLLLRESEIRELVTAGDVLGAVRDAFVALWHGQVEQPPVLSLDLRAHNGDVHVKGAHLHESPSFVIKVASGFYDNPRLGLPVVGGAVWVFSASTGALEAILLDNGYLTDLRTGAAGALSTDLLARERVGPVAIVGAGGQARHQLRALCDVRDPSEIRVWARRPAAARDFAEEMAGELGRAVTPYGELEDAVDGAGVIVTTTPSRRPLVRGSWVAPGAHVVAIGSDLPGKCELDPALLARATVVADRLEQCREQGEIAAALSAGTITLDDVTAELGQVAAGDHPGRRSEEEITVADLTGVGALDAAAAAIVTSRAFESGMGERLRV